MTGSVPPPGWYPDPANDQQLRWWTGERWTGAARPLEDQPADAGVLGPELLLGVGEVDEVAPVDVQDTPPGGEHTLEPGLEPGPEAASEDETATIDRSEPSTSAAATVDDRVAVRAPVAAGVPAHAAAHRTALADGDATWGIATPPDDPVEEGWTRERIVAASVMGGLVVLSLGIWLVAVVLTGSGNGSSPAPGTADAASDTEDATESEDAEPQPDEDAPAGEPSDEGGGDGDDGEADGDGARTVDFDGACEVELDDDQVAADTPLRPWQFDECAGAPIDLGGGDGRWIVVIASIDGELDAAEARDRAADHGSGYGVLWSTHYPSLNPGWWVVFDGPFSNEDDATDAADDAAGGAYPRLLSDDEDDRYCIADDGC